MQEVSAGKPFCGWLGLAEGEEGKGVVGKRRDKGGLMLPNCVHEAELLTTSEVRAVKEAGIALDHPQ